MKRKFLFTLIVLLAAITSAQADGTLIDGLYYNLDATTQTAEVTYQNDNSTSNSIYVTGSLGIPETVTYNDITYSVTGIGSLAFSFCRGLTSINIPESVTSIGRYAFWFCTGLTSVTIPESVTSIGDNAFNACESLTSATIPNSVTNIGDYAFHSCSSLTSINIPESVTSIGGGVFFWCDNLTSITIPESVTSIGERAFYWCSGLTSINIPESVTSIGKSAFYNCSSLTIVDISDITAWCAIDFDTSDANPLWYGANLYLNGDLVTDLIIPETVETIRNYAFSGCSSLTSVTIHESVTDIGPLAFANDSLTSIYNYSTIPQNIDYYDYGDGYDVFYGVNTDTCVLYVPKESVEAYKNAPVWKDFMKIVAIGGSVETAIEEVSGENNTSATRKVVENGNIYFLTPDGRKVTIQGAEVK